MRHRVTIALAISVVLNMLLGGMLLGDVSSRLVQSSDGFDMQAQLAKLPPDKQALFSNIIGPAKTRMDSERAQIDEAKKEAIHILTAGSFDASGYLTQVQHINGMRAQMKRHIAEAVAELAKQLTSEQRAIISDILSHPPFTTVPPGAAKH